MYLKLWLKTSFESALTLFVPCFILVIVLGVGLLIIFTSRF